MNNGLAEWRRHWGEAESGAVAQRVLFENDAVRVWEIVLEPGEELAVHTHALDYVIVTIESSEMEVRDQHGQRRQTAMPRTR